MLGKAHLLVLLVFAMLHDRSLVKIHLERYHSRTAVNVPAGSRCRHEWSGFGGEIAAVSSVRRDPLSRVSLSEMSYRPVGMKHQRREGFLGNLISFSRYSSRCTELRVFLAE